MICVRQKLHLERFIIQQENWKKAVKQRMYGWTLVTDVMGIEVLKCALIKQKSKWRNIFMWIKCLNIPVNWKCNTIKNTCKWNKFK